MSESAETKEDEAGPAAGIEVATAGVGCGFEALGCLSGLSIILGLLPLAAVLS